MQIGQKQEVVERVVYCDPATGAEVPEPKELPAGAKGPDKITFGLRRSLTGRDAIAVANAGVGIDSTSRRGGVKMCPGEARRARVCCTVAWIKGDLVDASGAPITAMTEAVFNDLPAWLTTKIYGWCGEIDEESAIDEGESSGQ